MVSIRCGLRVSRQLCQPEPVRFLLWLDVGHGVIARAGFGQQLAAVWPGILAHRYAFQRKANPMTVNTMLEDPLLILKVSAFCLQRQDLAANVAQVMLDRF